MFKRFMSFALKALALAMGVAVIVLRIIGELNAEAAFPLLAISLTAMALDALQKDTLVIMKSKEYA
jgi:hypothetical protein